MDKRSEKAKRDARREAKRRFREKQLFKLFRSDYKKEN